MKMCWLTNKQKTIEEIIAEKSAGMTDQQKAEYWWELSQNIFALLGKVEVPIYTISFADWLSVAQAAYPALTDVKMADYELTTTSLEGMQEILSRDWTNLVPYQMPAFKCDNFATLLYSHLVLYYGIKGIVPVWGDTDAGYHGFELGVLKNTDKFVARLVEPQSDTIFENVGPLGRYVPRVTAIELGIKRR
jgi:hypothetical protein